MKSIPLRQLLREPTKVKKMTRTGQSVQVTDNGLPLWILQPAFASDDSPERAKEIDQLLDEVLHEPVSQPTLSQIVKDARR